MNQRSVSGSWKMSGSHGPWAPGSSGMSGVRSSRCPVSGVVVKKSGAGSKADGKRYSVSRTDRAAGALMSPSIHRSGFTNRQWPRSVERHHPPELVTKR